MGFASVFAVTLALFIAKPAMPGKLRYAFDFNSDKPVASNELLMAQGGDITAFNSKTEKGQQDPLELFYSSDSKDIDEVFVRLLTESQMGKKLANIQPIAPREVYGVNRYRLDNGEDVVVYTQIPLTQVSTRESF